MKKSLAGIIALSAAAVFAQTPEYDKATAPRRYTDGMWVLGEIFVPEKTLMFHSLNVPAQRTLAPGEKVASNRDNEISGSVAYRASMPDGSALFSYTCIRDGSALSESHPLKAGEKVTIGLDCSELNPHYAKPRATLTLTLIEMIDDKAHIEARLK